MSFVLTPISLRQSLNMPIQSLNVPIFATFPGITPSKFYDSLLPSLRFENRRPLLHIRSQAFLRIFTLEKNLLILALHCKSRLHRNLPSSLHRTLDPPHSLRGLIRRAELLGVLHHVFHETIALVNVVDNSELL